MALTSARIVSHVFRRLRLALVAVLLVFLSTIPVPADSPYVRVTRQAEEVVEFSVRIPAEAVQITEDADGLRVVEIDGTTRVLQAGAPELPVLVLVFGVPVGAEPWLEYEVTDEVSLEGPAVRPVAGVAADGPGVRRLPDPTIYSGSAVWPTEPVTFEVVQYRELRLARLLVYPARFDPRSGALSLARSIDVRLEFRGGRGYLRAGGKSAPLTERIVGRYLLNRNDVVANRREKSSPRVLTSPRPLPTAPQKTASNPGVKIRVGGAGLFRVSHADLLGVGFDPTNVDPRNLELSFRGTPLPCRVFGEEDGSFDAGDVLEFYGFPNLRGYPHNNRYTSENVFWLVETGGPGRRFEARPATPRGAQLATFFSHTEQFEEGNELYTFGKPAEEGDPHFYWKWFEDNPNPPRVQSLQHSASLPGLTAGDGATIRALLLGRTDPVADPDHELAFRVNGTVVGATTWNGQTLNLAEVPFDSSLLSPGSNTFRLEYQSIAFPDIYFLDWFEIEYPRATAAVADRLTLTTPGGLLRWRVSGLSAAADPLVLDVTDPLEPVRLDGFTLEGSGPYTLSFQEDAPAGSRYHVVGDPGRASPAALELDVPSSLRDPANAADLIIVTPDGWEDSLADLVTHRQEQGLRVVVANLTDVADEFTGGNVDDLAIRDLVAWAFAEWQPPAVSYLLLVGEPNMDPQNWIDPPGSFRYAMPTHFGVTATQGETMTDTWFGTVDGDEIPDVAVGRFSVYQASQAELIVEKLLRYDNAAPSHAWYRDLLLVASDGSQFEESLDDAAALAPSQSFDVVRQYRRLGATTESIGNAIDAGALIVSFLGHGNISFWADAGSGPFFELDDVQGVANYARPAFVTALNCLNGHVADPVKVVSVAESFHNHGSAGAVAVWASAAQGYLYEYDLVQRTLYGKIFRDRVLEVGGATTAALVETYLTHPIDLDVIREMVLLGDPSEPLKVVCDPSPDDNCDGYDDDCDGVPDDEFPIEASSCGLGACASTGELQCVGGVVVDSCLPARAEFDDTTCDGLDDDCDGQLDEDFEPYDTFCGVGACSATGTARCLDGVLEQSCLPGEPAVSDGTCDGVDDDCDGLIDEDYASEATECGVGACAASGQRLCVAGVPEDTCIPGEPADFDAICDGFDDDCDGLVDEDYGPKSTECGVGACAANGQTSCVAGVLEDSCVPGEPAAADGTCDGVDDDCDGLADEDYASPPTECGVGACVSSGELSCVAGVLEDTCVAGDPAASDTTCDGVDDDCNGLVDEDYASPPTECGVGACVASGELTCVAGVLEDSCVAGEPAANDATCDGVDDDCDGLVDEDYASPPTQCGVGACRSTGELACVAGVLENTCVAGQPTPEVCDGNTDNDCDGMADESDAIDAGTWYADLDGDGIGDDDGRIRACEQLPGTRPQGGDCDDANAGVWSTPGEASGLRPVGTDRLEWDNPQDLGGVTTVAHLLRATDPTDFAAASCIPAEGEGAGAAAVDTGVPATDTTFYYLVRLENTCPDGTGSLGSDSTGSLRSGRTCR